VATRRARITAIAFGAFVFLGISVLVGRVLVGPGAERARAVDVVRAQARGDADAVLALMPSCRANPMCARLTRERTAGLARPGNVQVLNYEPSAQVTFTDRSGRGRIAWKTDQRTIPVVQCVVVRRQGPLTGGGAEILSISNPIRLDGACD
jgi:hypothetical protein